MAKKTYLEIVNECDNFPYSSNDPVSHRNILLQYVVFKLDRYDSVLGYVRKDIASKIASSEYWTLDNPPTTLTFCPKAEDRNKRDAILMQEMQRLRESKQFRVLDGWRDEQYPIYGLDRELLLSMERSCTPLFGVVTYGVHMTGFVRTGEGLKIWAPRRSLTKQTYPGMMDNTVAGGLTTGEDPFACLVRECDEEASLPEHIVQHARAVGTLTYFHLRDSRAGGETGLCQPECQYIYDLEVPLDVVLKPNDDEAIDFQLLTLEEVKTELANGKFKPNCALLLVEFFVRHGIISAENEPDYIEIVSRLHRRLDFPTR